MGAARPIMPCVNEATIACKRLQQVSCMLLQSPAKLVVDHVCSLEGSNRKLPKSYKVPPDANDVSNLAAECEWARNYAFRECAEVNFQLDQLAPYLNEAGAGCSNQITDPLSP